MNAFFEEHMEPLLYFFIMATIIRVYFNLLKYMYSYEDIVHNDILNKVIFTIPGIEDSSGKFSFWPISHVLFFCFMGYRFPNKLLFCFLIGMLWEVYEKLQKIMIEDSYKFNRSRDKSGNVEYLDWWDSSTRDIYLNGLGLGLSVALHAGIKAYTSSKT